MCSGFLLIGYCCSKTQAAASAVFYRGGSAAAASSEAKTFRELWRSAMGQNTEKLLGPAGIRYATGVLEANSVSCKDGRCGSVLPYSFQLCGLPSAQRERTGIPP